MSYDHMKELLNEAAEAMTEFLEDYTDYPSRSEVERFISETADTMTPDNRRELVDLLSSDYSLGTKPDSMDGPWEEVWPIIQGNVYERVQAQLEETYADWEPPVPEFETAFKEGEQVYVKLWQCNGTITQLDMQDPNLPYLVQFENGHRSWWSENDLEPAHENQEEDENNG